MTFPGRTYKEKPRIYTWLENFLDFVGLSVGGEEEDRTPDLRIANAALSQLSYFPELGIVAVRERAFKRSSAAR